MGDIEKTESGNKQSITYGDNGEPGLLQTNPLPLCPGSPNCVRISLLYEGIRPDQLLLAAVSTIHKMKANILEQDMEGRTLTCLFNVFIFKDDFNVVIQEHENGAVLHARSSSRVGYGDLGVNRKRMGKFLLELESIVIRSKES